MVVFDRFIVTIALALNFYIMKRHFENENDIHPKSVFFPIFRLICSKLTVTWTYIFHFLFNNRKLNIPVEILKYNSLIFDAFIKWTMYT